MYTMPNEMRDFQLQDYCKVEALEVESSPLPPGFRFHPTDEELVGYYLTKKVEDNHCIFQAIDEVNLNKCEPWDLPAKAKVGENAWYFFSVRDRKYPTGMRTNRATEAGYWKATGKDREVMNSITGRLVGMKKTLVFYTGRAPKGEKTNWIMHEYRTEGEAAPITEWVVCRVFKKNAGCRKSPMESHPGASYHTDLDDTDQQGSTYLPALLDSPTNRGQVVRASGGYSGVVSLANHQGTHHHEQDVPRVNNFNNWAVRRDVGSGVNDALENLVSGWDMQSADWIWDVPAG